MVRDLPGLARLEDAFASGERQAIRSALAELDAEEREALEARLGAEAVARLFRSTRLATRATPSGKVVVLHGIMGGRLDVESNGDVDRVWLNYFRLFAGRLADLRLPVGRQKASPGRVRVAGLLPEYMPLTAELGTRWDVLPFAYDWRDDLDKAADELATRIGAWRDGQPVHLLAHSMGGLVARCLVHRHRDLWRAMQDPASSRRGGRLIMLGTPNRGSLSIPLVLSGRERTVRLLELADQRHDMAALLEIIGTFGGCYQMLPSHRIELGDDRARLYRAATWGDLPVHAPLLERAQAFHDRLHEVIDPERLVYVAGYDRPTPYRIRVDRPGTFSYQETLDGDSRVPHELGLLDDVRTLWVNETHGDLQRNAAVLAGIHELLETGDTGALEHARPVRRAAVAARWKSAEALDVVPAEVLATLAKGVTRGPKATPDAKHAAALEAEIARAWVGGPAVTRGEAAGRGIADGRRPAGRAPQQRLEIQVVWGDITRADGHLYVAGHYENVLPQFAERALDRVVSGSERDEDLVLTRLARRGVLRGQLGDVSFFPWSGKHRGSRTVAIAGMGHPGTFGWSELSRFARNLTWAVASLPAVETMCTVLIGTGAGNLPVSKAVDGLVAGIVDALGQLDRVPPLRRVLIVEMQLFKAVEIQRALREQRDRGRGASGVALIIADDIAPTKLDTLDDEPSLALALAAAASAATGVRPEETRALTKLLGMHSGYARFVPSTLRVLSSFAPRVRGELVELAQKVVIAKPATAGAADGAPTRISFVAHGADTRCAAITNTSVIQERRISIDASLVDEAIRDMTDPPPDRVPRLSKMLLRLLLPRDFRELLEGSHALVFEVDRTTARLHCEMIARSATRDDDVLLAQQLAVARQLRTEYSPPPEPDRPSVGRLRALVIGDPGDPAEGHALPGACEEAVAVHELLTALGVDTDTLIGAPNAERPAKAHAFRPAARLEVLGKLMAGEFDILHYAGHGGWDPADPSRTGWLFKGGILSSRELERIDLAPRLVVANACLSARISDALRRGERIGPMRDEAELLPGIADEFFRRGVRNYVGTAWEISDIGAIEFTRAFYRSLLTPTGTVGAALLAARQALFARRDVFGSLWAAYQHYGEPSEPVGAAPGVDARTPSPRGSDRPARVPAPPRRGRRPRTPRPRKIRARKTR